MVPYRGVAERARTLPLPAPDDAELVKAAAWLHDIGYASVLAATGLHALDGARYVRTAVTVPRLATLVAHHSCASIEAEERGLVDVLLSELPLQDAQDELFVDMVTYCDMATSPTGEPVFPKIASTRSCNGTTLPTSCTARSSEPGQGGRRPPARLLRPPLVDLRLRRLPSPL